MQMFAAACAQIAVFGLGTIGVVEFTDVTGWRFATALLGLWFLGAAAATSAHFYAARWTSNQRSGGDPAQSLVSDERGQVMDGPPFVTAGTIVAIFIVVIMVSDAVASAYGPEITPTESVALWLALFMIIVAIAIIAHVLFGWLDRLTARGDTHE